MEQLKTMEVLIIEDDPKIAEINRRFVEKIEGFTVIGIATDELQAKEQLDVLKPDLVLLDIYFPNSNGLELLEFIRQNHKEIDVIMITAAKELDSLLEAVRGGAFDYIVKPVVFQRLEESFIRYLEFRRKVFSMGPVKGHIGQSDIDELLRKSDKKEIASSTGYLPKGIDKLTLDKVIQVISASPEGMTADQVAKLVGVSRTTGRRYLEHLVSLGDVYADLSYGVVGRPERVYRANHKKGHP